MLIAEQGFGAWHSERVQRIHRLCQFEGVQVAHIASKTKLHRTASVCYIICPLQLPNFIGE